MKTRLTEAELLWVAAMLPFVFQETCETRWGNEIAHAVVDAVEASVHKAASLYEPDERAIISASVAGISDDYRAIVNQTLARRAARN